jgi:HSP20 family protein
MVLRRNNGSHPLMQLREEMDRLVTNFFGPAAAGGGIQARVARPFRSFPPLNIWEDADTIYVEAEIPGLKSEEIEISVVGNDLTIRGRRGGEPREAVAYHRQERGVGEFNRVLRLPGEVDGSKIEAVLADGVLLIKLPKAEAAKAKKIKVATPQ